VHQVKIEYHKNGKIENKSFSMNHLGENKTFQDILKNYKIETIHSQEATLEDVFIKTTGKRLI
jgi:fluoroquinolone transport system ATP-binding protein